MIRNIHSQRAATLTEYAMILAILFIVFFTFGKALEMSAGKRARESVRAVESDVPCPASGQSSSGSLGTDPKECM